MRKWFRVIILTLICNTTFWPLTDYERIEQLIWKGREAGAAGDWDTAIASLEKTLSIAESAGFNDIRYDWLIEPELKILHKIKKLKPVKDPHVYKVLTVFIDSLDAEVYTGKKENIIKKRVKVDLMPDTEKNTRTFFEYQRHFYEAFSDGNLVVEVTYIRPGFTLTAMEVDDKEKKNSLDLTSLAPAEKYHRFLYENTPKYDVICYIWPKPDDTVADATGGYGLQDVLLPGMWSAPLRGYMTMPDLWMNSVVTRRTFVHELYHTIEYNLGIRPSHAWYEGTRSTIPDWKGRDEYDYYQWRFDNHVRPYGWANLNYKERFPLRLEKQAFENYLALFLKYGPDKAYTAWNLTSDEKYDQAFKAFPAFPRAYYKSANAAFQSKDYVKAYDLLYKFRAIDPGDAEGRLLELKILVNTKQYDKARTLTGPVLTTLPLDFWQKNSIQWYIKTLARNTPDSEEAIKIHDMLIKMDPENARYYAWKGDLYFNKGRYEEALNWYEQALKKSAGDALYLVYIGEVKWKLTRYLDAKDYFKKAMAANPMDYIKKEISDFLTDEAYNAKNSADKKELLGLAYEYYPENGYTDREAAFFFYDAGNKSKAIEYFKLSADHGFEKSVESLKKYYGIDYKPQPPARKTHPGATKVGLYSIDGDMEAFSDVFINQPDYELIYLDPDDMQNGVKLKGLDVLIVPGGNPGQYCDPIGDKGMDNIRAFISNGGGFIGVCAGAYFGIADWYLGVFAAGIYNGYYWKRGSGDIRLELTDEGKKVFGDIEGAIPFRYVNGTMMERVIKDGLQPYTSLAVYKTGLADNGAPDIMVGRDAIISGTYGKGKVLTFSPHPEHTSGKEYLLLKAVDYVAPLKKK